MVTKSSHKVGSCDLAIGTPMQPRLLLSPGERWNVIRPTVARCWAVVSGPKLEEKIHQGHDPNS